MQYPRRVAVFIPRRVFSLYYGPYYLHTYQRGRVYFSSTSITSHITCVLVLMSHRWLTVLFCYSYVKLVLSYIYIYLFICLSIYLYPAGIPRTLFFFWDNGVVPILPLRTLLRKKKSLTQIVNVPITPLCIFKSDQLTGLKWHCICSCILSDSRYTSISHAIRYYVWWYSCCLMAEFWSGV